MIVKDDLPLSTVEKKGFLYLIKTVAPLYKVPGKTAISSLVDTKYEIIAQKVKEKLKEAIAISLTTDGWTDPVNTKSYLGVTCHFVDDTSKKLCSYILAVEDLDESHNAEYLGETLKNICSRWEIKNLMCVTTDNAGNIVNAVKNTFGANKHLSCFAHSMNLVANMPYHEKKGIPELRKVLFLVKDIVKFFKHCVSATDDLKKSQSDLSSPLKLIQSVPTRWNSTFYQLERFLKLSDKIAPIMLKYSRSPPMLTSVEMNIIKDVINIYRPIEQFTKEICGESYATSSLVIPLLNCIVEEFRGIVPDTSLGVEVKRVLLDAIQKRFSLVEKNMPLVISTILDPRFKKIHFQNTENFNAGVEEIKKLMSCGRSPQKTIYKISDVQIAEQNTSLWSLHHKLAVEEKCDSGTTECSELDTYLVKPLLDIKADIISYWCNQKQESISNLDEIALRYHTIMSTSVPCERAFSLAGNVLTDKRNRLEKLDKILFLKSVEFEKWHI